MFCIKCGAQVDDAVSFCIRCGTPVAGRAAQPNVGQPVYAQQPAYAVPGNAQAGAPKASKKTLIIIASCVVAVAVFLVILFTVILSGGSLKNQLTKYKWSAYSGIMTYDFKNNVVNFKGSDVDTPMEWKLTDNDQLTIKYLTTGGETTWTVKLSDDGKSLSVKNNDDPTAASTWTRLE